MTPTIDDAMAIVLAALSLLGLGIFGPGIASGLVSGGPQLGAGAAVGTGLAAGGMMLAGGAAAGMAAKGGAAALSGGAAAVRGGAAAAGAASAAYRGAAALIGKRELVPKIGEAIVNRGRGKHENFGLHTCANDLVHQFLIAGFPIFEDVVVAEIVGLINHDEVVIPPIDPV